MVDFDRYITKDANKAIILASKGCYLEAIKEDHYIFGIDSLLLDILQERNKHERNKGLEY